MLDTLDRLKAALADRYTLQRELGRGGMATVYLAEDLKHHRPVALKVLKPELAAALGPDRFLREIELSARLTHPHILPLHDSGNADAFLYYVMPYVEGESLRDRLQREKQLPVDDALQISREVADALSYAHARGVIHRDIKPENVLLESGHAVVADFGIARAIDVAGGEKLTGTGVALGTPTYMSPEQAAGSRDLDGRSDLYSLACVLYEMLVGQPPFTGPTVESIVQQHLTVAPTPVTRVRPAVPVDVARVISRALEKTPADRYATTAQFVEALARGRSPAPASAEAVAPAQHHGRPGAAVSQRHRGPWWAWAAAALGLVVGTLGVWRLRASPAGSEAPQSVAAAAGQSSVAVLPFDNLGGRPEDLYLSEGITEEIIGQLAQVGGLKVISRTSVVALKGSGLTLPQIADTLGVRHILEGSVRRAGTRIRVAAQLIDARTDVHLWAESYERELTDVFSVQEEIARQVSAALVTTVGELRGAGPRSRTRDPGAYGAYLRGKYLLHRRTPDAMRGARIDFEQAIALDSGFAPAWGGLAAALGLPVTYGYGDVDPYVAYGRAVAAATRGIALDSGLADAYAARAYVLTKAMFPANVVHADIRRALKLSPNSADVHGWYAHYLSREGDYGRAIEEADRAIALDPLAPGRRLGMAYDALGARRYDLASREAQGAAALEPGLTLARALGGLADLLSGRPERCAPSGDLVPYVGVAAACLDAAGRHAEAAALVDSLRVSLGRGTTTTDYSASVPLGELAVYYAWIGDARQSLSWLEEAFNLSPQAVDYRIIASGVFDRVRSDPAFRAGYARIRERVRARTEVEIQRAHPAPRRVLGPDPQ